MSLAVLADAPCQVVVLDPENESVIARCRYTLGAHPRGGGASQRRHLHEDGERIARWWTDDNGDTHLAVRPGAACLIGEAS